jgi:hypothetical protein
MQSNACYAFASVHATTNASQVSETLTTLRHTIQQQVCHRNFYNVLVLFIFATHSCVMLHCYMLSVSILYDVRLNPCTMCCVCMQLLIVVSSVS